MLVDKKFYYVSLPRCGSTSFHFSCLRQNIPIQTHSEEVDLAYQALNLDDFTNEELAENYEHRHEPLIALQEKFGYDYPIIAVKRDRHETFISLWKHILFQVKLHYSDLYEQFSKFTIDDVLFFEPDAISIDFSEMQQLAAEFLKRNNIEWKWYLSNIMITLYTPKSFWHANDKNIIWFDFDKLNEMEDWISSKLQQPFKLENFNSSKHIETEIKLDNYFKARYNVTYDIHDIRKLNKTLI